MNTWEANIRKVVPYTPGEQPNQPDMIKLNTNENPYPPAPGVEKALHGIQPDTLRLYPDPTAGDLVHAIARNYGLKDEQVFVGVGSDDVLAMSFLTFFNSDKPILFQISPILSMTYGRIFSESHMNVKLSMRTSVSAKKITSEKTVELFFRTPMHLQAWSCPSVTSRRFSYTTGTSL